MPQGKVLKSRGLSTAGFDSLANRNVPLKMTKLVASGEKLVAGSYSTVTDFAKFRG